MTEQFVPYEIALKLKQLGFDEECFAKYYTNYNPPKLFFAIKYKHYYDAPLENFKMFYDGKDEILAPLWQQALDFFRNKYQLNSIIQQNNIGWMWAVRLSYSREPFDFTGAVSYEEARNMCLEKLIELICE